MITGMLFSDLLMDCREIVLGLILSACTRMLIMCITVIIRIINIHVVNISKNGKQVMCFIFAKL